MKAENIIASRKICFINRIWNERTDYVCRQLLINDHKKCIDSGEKSILEEVNELCRERDILPITNYQYSNENLKGIIVRDNDVKCWRETLKSRISIIRTQINDRYSWYYDFMRNEGRAVLLWRCGALMFKSHWKQSKDGRKKHEKYCPHPLCGKFDTIHHAMKCPFMMTKINRESNHDKTMASFILRLNKERQKYQRPIITH